MMDIKGGLASMVYKVFDKRSAKVSGFAIKQSEQLAKKLHKPIIRKFEKRKIHSSFKDNIWGADLADMQSISKFSVKEFVFYYLLLTFLVNMYGLLLWKTK